MHLICRPAHMNGSFGFSLMNFSITLLAPPTGPYVGQTAMKTLEEKRRMRRQNEIIYVFVMSMTWDFGKNKFAIEFRIPDSVICHPAWGTMKETPPSFISPILLQYLVFPTPAFILTWTAGYKVPRRAIKLTLLLAGQRLLWIAGNKALFYFLLNNSTALCNVTK